MRPGDLSYSSSMCPCPMADVQHLLNLLTHRAYDRRLLLWCQVVVAIISQLEQWQAIELVAGNLFFGRLGRCANSNERRLIGLAIKQSLSKSKKSSQTSGGSEGCRNEIRTICTHFWDPPEAAYQPSLQPVQPGSSRGPTGLNFQVPAPQG